MISASLDAWLRPSSSSQPKTRIMIRYRRRRDTTAILPQPADLAKPQVTAPASSSEAVQAVRVEQAAAVEDGECAVLLWPDLIRPQHELAFGGQPFHRHHP